MPEALPQEIFYTNLAEQYDAMTRFDQRREGEKEMLRLWVDRFRIRSALDAACGTGLHALLLAELGVRTVGVDLSAAMLEQASRHAAEAGVQVTWIQSSLQRLHRRLTEQFDAVFCLGNSIPHVLNPRELKGVLGNFSRALRSGGWLVMQLLNYVQVLKRSERIVGVHRAGNSDFVRFYDFGRKSIRFNILTLAWKDNQCSFALNSTLLRPYRAEDLEPVLSSSGFADMVRYGDMRFAPFDAETSMNLVIVARKSEASRC